jgi:hypothetical protein
MSKSELDVFVETNRDFASALLNSVGLKSGVRSVHIVFGCIYGSDGKSRPDLRGKPCILLGYEKNKQKYDFIGGKCESKHPDNAVQFLETFFKELYEEISVKIHTPLENIIREILRCGRDNKSLLVVCGVQGIGSVKINKVADKKKASKKAIHHSYLEMDHVMYFGKKDSLIKENSTSYVQQQFKKVFEIVKDIEDPPLARKIMTTCWSGKLADQ